MKNGFQSSSQTHLPGPPARQRWTAATDAFSLVELTVAMFILTILGMATLGTLLQTRKMTEGSIHLGTATTIAQGYMEQLKNMNFADLDRPVLPTKINQGADDPLEISPLLYDPEDGGSVENVNVEVGSPADRVNTKLVDINNTPDNTNDDMPLDVVVYVQDITDPIKDVGQCRRIALRYTYTDPADTSEEPRRYTQTIISIRSNVPTY